MNFQGDSENPLLSYLPPVQDTESTALLLSYGPKARDAEFFQRPWYHRFDAIAHHDEIHAALSYEVLAYRCIHSHIRRCYTFRNPASPQVQEHLYAINALAESDWVSGRAFRTLQRLIPSGGGGLGFTIDGPTGIGKSSFSDRIFEVFKGGAPITHSVIGGKNLRQRQLTILRTSCTGEGLKDVCYDLLQRGDAALNTDYSRIGRRAATLWEYVHQVLRMATSNYVGMVMIDDLQRLAEFNDQSERTLRLLSNFMQATGIPILTFGTHRVKKVLGSPQNTQEGAKLMGLGHQTFNRIAPGGDWDKLNQAIWRFRVSHPHQKMPLWLPSVTHWLAQGLPRYLRFLMDEVFRRMVRQEKNIAVDKNLIVECACVALGPYQEALNNLRTLSIGGTLDSGQYVKYEHLLNPGSKDALEMPDDYPAREKEMDESKATPSPRNADEATASATDTMSDKEKVTNNVRSRKKVKTDSKNATISKIANADNPHEMAKKLGLTDDF